jgi:hypothetical protein
MAGVHSIRRWLKGYQVGGTAAEACERLIDRCQANGMTVILVGVPLTKAHRDLYTPGIEHGFLTYVEDVADRHGCRFVDYRDRVPDDMFLDNHHVLRSGGEYFSRILTDEVLIGAWYDRQEQKMNAVAASK